MGVGPKPPPTDFVGIKPTRRPNSGDYAVVTPYAMSTSCLPGPLGLACGGVSESEGLSHRFTGGRACPVNVDLRCPVSTCTGGTRRSRAHADNGLLDALGPFSQCCRRAGVPRSDQPRAAGSRCTQMPLAEVNMSREKSAAGRFGYCPSKKAPRVRAGRASARSKTAVSSGRCRRYRPNSVEDLATNTIVLQAAPAARNRAATAGDGFSTKLITGRSAALREAGLAGSSVIQP